MLRVVRLHVPRTLQFSESYLTRRSVRPVCRLNLEVRDHPLKLPVRHLIPPFQLRDQRLELPGGLVFYRVPELPRERHDLRHYRVVPDLVRVTRPGLLRMQRSPIPVEVRVRVHHPLSD